MKAPELYYVTHIVSHPLILTYPELKTGVYVNTGQFR